MSVVRCRVVVFGRVQGVFYRDSCRARAIELAVGGWVRNLPDGSVELVAEGGRDAVEQLLDWCREGPPHANVTALEISDEPPRGEQQFRIVFSASG